MVCVFEAVVVIAVVDVVGVLEAVVVIAVVDVVSVLEAVVVIVVVDGDRLVVGGGVVKDVASVVVVETGWVVAVNEVKRVVSVDVLKQQK